MASIFSAKNETILALGNANLDFSLVKVEVKKEYEGLGQALSVKRRENAENGQQHRTARRLFALFEDLIPNIDVLARAYGQRASEIAMVHDRDARSGAKLSSVGSAAHPSMSFQFGPFASHAGVDGTSIYAAASSGCGVIALHLLACMVAKVFTSVEATAIWVQLVECRLDDLNTKAGSSQLSGVKARMAATIGSDIRREDLAAWDASARAWLEVANTVKRREDTQVKLIFRNIPNIQATNKTYNDMIENWKVAMVTLQNAIQGVPQDISNSAALLGITAWHIYPDIIVFDPIKHIHLNDALVHQGGTISLGLVRNRAQDDGDVNWSVSLSHLRYYGEPVAIERSLTMDTDRITIQDLQYIALGCVFSSWTNSFSLDVVEASECLVALGDCIGLPGDEVPHQSDLDWLALLVAAAKNLLKSHGDGRENALYFIEFGRRRGRSFLDDSFQDIIPMFGLLNPYQLFRVSRDFEQPDQEVEQRIGVYRELALNCGFGNDECIVLSLPKVISRGSQRYEDVTLNGHWEIASARPVQRSTNKRFQDGTLRSMERHLRWVHLDRTFDPALQYLVEQGTAKSEFQASFNWDESGKDWDDMQSNPLACSCLRENRKCDKDCSCRRQNKKCNSLCQCLQGFTGIQESLTCENVRACRMEYDAPEEDCHWLSFRSTMDVDHSTSLQNHHFVWKDPPIAIYSAYQLREQCSEFEGFLAPIAHDQQEVLYNFEASDSRDDFRMNATGGRVKFQSVHTHDRAALYLTDRSDVNMPPVTFQRLKNALISGRVSPGLLRSHLSHVGRHGVKDYTKSLAGVDCTGRMFFRSLHAIAAVVELYQSWPDATIKISVTKSPIGASRWAQNLKRETIDLSSRLAGHEHHHTKTSVSRIHRATKFACIVMMESGGIDLHPDQLDMVMGIATGNSIYAAEYLLQDPSAEDLSGKSSFSGIRRIIGSLGEPGIVCLIPPKETKKVELDGTRYRIVRHDLFDGTMVDRFDQSSLHLTLTAWKLNLAVGQGSIDADVLLREALVSLFDGSRWIADLDILKALEDLATLRFFPCACPEVDTLCSPTEFGKQLMSALGNKLKSISRWEELLLCQDNLLPEEIGAIRTSGNWYARLAAMALASSIGSPLTILPSGKMCLQCGKRLSSWQPSTPKFGQSPNLLIM